MVRFLDFATIHSKNDLSTEARFWNFQPLREQLPPQGALSDPVFRPPPKKKTTPSRFISVCIGSRVPFLVAKRTPKEAMWAIPYPNVDPKEITPLDRCYGPRHLKNWNDDSTYKYPQTLWFHGVRVSQPSTEYVCVWVSKLGFGHQFGKQTCWNGAQL